MPDKPSRREILGSAAVGVASIAVPVSAIAQSGHDSGMDELEKGLAKPLSPEARKLLAESLKGIHSSASDRLKTKLPENSEPCFSYAVSPREGRSK